MGTTQTLASNRAYAPFGPVKSMDFSNGKTETRGFDLQYRPGTISVPDAVDLSYAYGPAGNISSVTDGLAVSGSFAPAVPDNEYSYAAGSDKLASLTGGQSTSLSYDNNGNITAKGNLTFEYYQDNRLSTVRQDGSIIASYDYNSLGQRTQKTVGDLTTLFHYDLNGNLICETGPDGTILKEYVYLGNLPLAMVVYGTEISVCYYHTNHLGTPVLLADSTGQVVWKADYYPFGKVGVTIATVENNLRFPGQYFDVETGLHYNWHRYYDPDTGRYLTSDPIGLEGGINPFVYCLNNPVNNIDPIGLRGVIGAFGSGSIAFIGGADVSGALLYDVGNNDWFGALDGQYTRGLQISADLGAGIIVAPFANAEDLSGPSRRISLRWSVSIDIAIPYKKWWATSLSLDFVPGIDFGFGTGRGYTILMGVDECN